MAAPISDPMQTEAGDAQVNQLPPSNLQEELVLPPLAPGPQTEYTATASSGGATPTQSTAPVASSLPRTATPTRGINGTGEVAPPVPAKAASHGAPTRRYLNEKVTGVLLEGMKKLAAEQPEAPLRVLGEFLLQRSEEIERNPAGS